MPHMKLNLWLRLSKASAEIIVLGLHIHQDWPVNMPIGSKEKFEAQFPQLLENAGGLEQGSRCYVTGVIKVTEHSFGSL